MEMYKVYLKMKSPPKRKLLFNGENLWPFTLLNQDMGSMGRNLVSQKVGC